MKTLVSSLKREQQVAFMCNSQGLIQAGVAMVLEDPSFFIKEGSLIPRKVSHASHFFFDGQKNAQVLYVTYDGLCQLRVCRGAWVQLQVTASF